MAFSKGLADRFNTVKNKADKDKTTSGAGKFSGGGSGGTSSSGGGGTSYIDSSGEKKAGYFSPSAPTGSSGYTQYTGGNTALDSQLKVYSDRYAQARASGDVDGMRAANDAANQLRNQYGYAAQYADKDIEAVKRQTGYGGGMGGVVSGSGSAYDPYAALLEEQRRREEAAARAAEEAKRAAVEQAVGQLSGQKGQVEQSYADLYRQLYLDRRMAEKNLPQQMAAMGYTGGLTESSALALQTGYNDALRQGEQQKISTLGDLDRAITDTRLQGDISIAEQAAQMAQQGFATYAELVQNQLAQKNWEKEFGFRQSQDERNFGFQQSQADRDWQVQLWSMSRQELLDQVQRSDIDYDRRLMAAQYLYENSGNADGLRMLGYTDEQITGLHQTYADMLAQRNRKGTGGGGSAGGYKPAMTYAQMMEQINSGVITPAVEAAFSYYNDGMDYGDWARGLKGGRQAQSSVPEGYTDNPHDLGYGPIGQANLEQLVAQGAVQVIQANGRLYYKAVQPDTGVAPGWDQMMTALGR